MEEILTQLPLKSGDIVVDATLGGGGHALALFEKVTPDGRLIAFDADQGALERFRRRVQSSKRGKEAIQNGNIVLVHQSFSGLEEALHTLDIHHVSAIFADLGLSSDQLNDRSRGFSFLSDGPLDMRFDTSCGESASDIVNTYEERVLAKIFSEYGDIRDAGKLAKCMVSERAIHPFVTTMDLVKFAEHTMRDRRASIPPATKLFQAIRIAVNREYEVLERFLNQAVHKVSNRGRIAVLSFHSGEDRIVKAKFREEARGCVCPKSFPVCRCGKKARLRLITKRPLVPSEEEIRSNSRSRSAKLRVAERIFSEET